MISTSAPGRGEADPAIVAEALAAVDPAPGTDPVEQRLAQWFRARPRLGRRERQNLSDVLYRVLRHRRLYEALARSRALSAAGAGPPAGPVPDPRTLARLAIERADTDPAALIAAVEAETGPLPPAWRLSLPDWLWQRLVADEGEERALAIGLGSLAIAPTDLRVNGLRARPDAARAALAAAGIVARPIAGLPLGLRIDGRVALESLPAFRAGAFERQDAGSQRIVAIAAPRRGQTVVDFCAGAGGKTLAMAAAMRNQGRILAFDRSDARLERLRERCRRAGVTIVTTMRIDDEHDARLDRYRERADLVLVDAPCSGTGTLRRDPGRKWQLQPDGLPEQADRQFSILCAASRLVGRGGRLVYATCSVLRQENEDVIGRFDAAATESALQSPRPTSSYPGGPVSPPVPSRPPFIGSWSAGDPDGVRWTPDRDESDGFYVAVRTRGNAAPLQ